MVSCWHHVFPVDGTSVAWRFINQGFPTRKIPNTPQYHCGTSRSAWKRGIKRVLVSSQAETRQPLPSGWLQTRSPWASGNIGSLPKSKGCLFRLVWKRICGISTKGGSQHNGVKTNQPTKTPRKANQETPAKEGTWVS